MAILSNGKFYGFLCSVKETGRKLANGIKEYVEDFVSGFAGNGWKLWEYVKGKWMLEIDAIRIRGQFTVFELLVSKIRAIIGAQTITQGCGKIKFVELSQDGTAYLITLEDKDMSFMEHDFIRCKEFTGSQRQYHVEIEAIVDGVIRIPISEFETDTDGNVLNSPAAGDDIVQFGNSSYAEKYVGRHSAIYMHADEGMQPAIDVLDGIYSKDWSSCLKVRLGGDIPGTNKLKGLYCVNGMIKSVDTNGATSYCIYPDGTAEFGYGSALFKPDKSGHIAGGAICWELNETKQYVCTMKGVVLTWDNLDDETKENLKGESGNDGADGTDGADGMNVYITYHDSESEPSSPLDDGTTNGWHTNDTSSVVWMSQKVAENASSGSWGNPIKIKGEIGMKGLQGIQGEKGEQGIQGPVGADGIASYFHIRYSSIANPTSSDQMSETPDTYIGTYIDSNQIDSDDPKDYTWYRFQGLQGNTGEQGIPGTNGENGQTSYLHIKYSDDGGESFTLNNGETPGAWIGVLVDFELNDSLISADYKWSKIKGENGTLPKWLEEWNGYATEIGDEYIVTPKMFSGTKTTDAEGKVLLTGIAQGKDCLTDAQGNKRTGIFALVDNEIVFELDPINKEYKFRGRVEVENGYISIAGSKILLKEDGGGQLADGKIHWTKEGYLLSDSYDLDWSRFTRTTGDGPILDLPFIPDKYFKIIRYPYSKYTREVSILNLITYSDIGKIIAPSAEYAKPGDTNLSEYTKTHHYNINTGNGYIELYGIGTPDGERWVLKDVWVGTTHG